jgi:hypothetical protein
MKEGIIINIIIMYGRLDYLYVSFLGKGTVRVVFWSLVQSKVQPGNTHAIGR